MFGDPAANAPVWSKYAVLLGSLTATVPNHPAAFTMNETSGGTADVTTQWDYVGALDSDTPFDDGAESVTTSDHSAAGFGVYGTTYKDQKETRSFTVKETTLITLGIKYDASGVTDTSGTLEGKLKRRDTTEKFLIAFHREDGTDCERYVSENHAYIESITRNFGNDESTFTVTVTIVPNTDDELYDYYKGPKS